MVCTLGTNDVAPWGLTLSTLETNVIHPGDQWCALRGSMVCTLGTNGVHSGDQWCAPWGPMVCTRGINGVHPEIDGVH